MNRNVILIPIEQKSVCGLAVAKIDEFAAHFTLRVCGDTWEWESPVTSVSHTFSLPHNDKYQSPVWAAPVNFAA